MFGGISLIGWFHSILGIAAILVGLYLLLRDRFIFMDTKLAKFYLLSTVITCASSFLLYGATGSFNTAHFLSVMTILAVIPTTAEVLQRLPPSDPFVDSIEDPLVQSFYMAYVVIFGIFSIYQVTRIYKGDSDGA